MSISNLLPVFMIVFLLPSSVAARNYSQMYSTSELQRANKVYSSNIRGMLFQDIARYLNNDELVTLRRVRLWQPWDRTTDPFEFSANVVNNVILIPTFSVKFLDDLSIAIAWFERFGCNKESVFDYVAALDFSDIDLPAPLTALKISYQAYRLDNYVDDVSQKTLKSALAFILLHELGHMHFHHKSYNVISPEQAQIQEVEADRFAMKLLRRMRLPPLGMTLWFMAVSMRDPLVSGSPRQKYPLTSNRLQAIARDLRTSPADFIEPANRGKVSSNMICSLANDIDEIGTSLSSSDMRSFLRERGRLVTPAMLGGACEAEKHDQEWLRRFRNIIK
ncbi:MAG: ImmA/IrrE family metallo-endopeptidase [Desulfobacteraceae bacterium]|nr:ImmA/IrrE family metallo-endopeptidase [Desulfobacteraceae bacterium]